MEIVGQSIIFSIPGQIWPAPSYSYHNILSVTNLPFNVLPVNILPVNILPVNILPVNILLVNILPVNILSNPWTNLAGPLLLVSHPHFITERHRYDCKYPQVMSCEGGSGEHHR